jgi:hypothetical protein
MSWYHIQSKARGVQMPSMKAPPPIADRAQADGAIREPNASLDLADRAALARNRAVARAMVAALSLSVREGTPGERRAAGDGPVAPRERSDDEPGSPWLKVALVVGTVSSLVAGWSLHPGPDRFASQADEELRDVGRGLEHERADMSQLARHLASALRELNTRAGALADVAAQRQELAELREQLAMLLQGRDLPLARPPGGHDWSGRDAVPIHAASSWREASGNPETRHLVERAALLLAHGDRGAARALLERAADMNDPSALFMLAETYDPIVLSTWGTIGTQSDLGKARQLYARASAAGIPMADARLNALAH